MAVRRLQPLPWPVLSVEHLGHRHVVIAGGVRNGLRTILPEKTFNL